jgi:hypothetical protein
MTTPRIDTEISSSMSVTPASVRFGAALTTAS